MRRPQELTIFLATSFSRKRESRLLLCLAVTPAKAGIQAVNLICLYKEKKMHGHNHGHTHSTSSPSKNLLIALIIIFIFAIIEGVGGWWANSLALISDAGHMLADTFSLLLAFVATWIANKPPSNKHSFGLGRAEILAAYMSSLLLLLLVFFIIYEAIRRLIHDTHSTAGGTIMLIAFIGLLANIFAAYILSRGEQNLNIKAAILHVLSDLLGSVAAIIAGAVIYFTGWLPIDAILSILISLLVLFATIRLLRETFSILMEGVPANLNLQEIGLAMAKIEHVDSVHDLHIWKLSSNQIMLSAHIDLQSMEQWSACLQNLQYMLHDKFDIDHVTLQPEFKILYQLSDRKI